MNRRKYLGLTLTSLVVGANRRALAEEEECISYEEVTLHNGWVMNYDYKQKSDFYRKEGTFTTMESKDWLSSVSLGVSIDHDFKMHLTTSITIKNEYFKDVDTTSPSYYLLSLMRHYQSVVEIFNSKGNEKLQYAKQGDRKYTESGEKLEPSIILNNSAFNAFLNDSYLIINIYAYNDGEFTFGNPGGYYYACKLRINLSGTKESYRLAKVKINQLDEYNKDKTCCYLTTAVCDHIGLSDNCFELNALRLFRDNYLMHQPGGKEDIDQYYKIAPAISSRLSEKDAFTLYWKYILPCALLSNAGYNGIVRKIYTHMARRLIAK